MADLDLDAIKQRARNQIPDLRVVDDVLDLIAEVKRLREEKALLGDALVGMVMQHTERLKDDNWEEYGHSFMRADESAFDVLVETGFAEHIDEGYSIRLKSEAF